MDKKYFDEIMAILDSNLSSAEKREKILQYHENDIADVMDELDADKRKELFEILGNEALGEVLLYADDIGDVVDDLPPEKAADIIETMDADDAIDVLQELDEESRDEIVSLMEKEAKEDIQAITKYDEDMIGSRMTNNYITILNTDTVKSAMRKVVKEAAENDNVTNIYVLDKEDVLVGVLELRALIIARDGDDLSKLFKTNYPSFEATESVEDCLPKLKEYGMDSYPILDENKKLIGVITSDDIIEALDLESGDDYAKLAGLTEEEDLDESVFQSVKKRIPWLIILLVLGLVQSISMSGFEAVVATLPIIVFFQTLVLDMAGNTGTQSLAVTIRMISTNEVTKKEVLKTIFKEVRVGFFNGILLGTIAFGVVLLYLFLANKGVGAGLNNFEIVDAVKGASIVAAALITAMTVSSFIGTVVPMIFLKLKIDPAVASGPFITTINDITAMLIYYGLAAILFNIVF